MITSYIKKYRKDRRHRRNVVGILCALSLLVSAGVFWQLRLEGVTLTNDACCGKAEHVHSETCLPTQRLICGMETAAAEAEEAEPQQMECRAPSHIHTELCWEETRTLVCTAAEEDPEHVHGDTCWETQRVLSCQEQEHIHTETCVSQAAASDHVHTQACYEVVYSCGFSEEHEHTISCYADPGADLETPLHWEATLPAALSGVWPVDLIAVAQSQYGYQESTANFILAPDGVTRMGYTRYGEWAGNPYGSWNALFAAFCLHYAGVPETVFPVASGASSWCVKLSDAGLYAEANGYLPQEGDLVFRADGTVGIIAAIRGADMYVLAGDIDNAVWQGIYSLSDPLILGYGCLHTAYQSYIGAANEAPAPEGGTAWEEISEIAPSLEEEAVSDEITTFDSAFYLMTAAQASGSEAPDYLGTIQSKNAWQIVRYGYNGRSQSDKLPFDGDGDGEPDVYLQKNVVPTATENEFLVYLSMDKKMTWETLLDNSEFYVTSANSYKKQKPGDVVTRINGNSTIVYPENAGNTSNQYLFTMQVYETKSDAAPVYVYTEYRYGSTPNCNNGTLLMRPEGWGSQYILIQSSVSLQMGSSNTLTAQIYLDELAANFSVYQTVLDQVSDTMGENITFLGVVNCDGTTAFDDTTGTLTWLPIDNAAVASSPEIGTSFSGWDENIAQLVYRVRLDTEREGFHSCADNMSSASGAWESYPVNREAVLSYHKEVLTGASGTQSGTMTAAFPVPEVRGLHYDIAFTVVDEASGEALAGAVFALYEADGETPVYVDGAPYTVTTSVSGVTKFRDLPCGTYVMKQIKAPPGYTAGETSVWTIPLNYTDHPEKLKQDTPPLDSDIRNMCWSGYDNVSGQWLIPNVKNPFTYQIRVIKTGMDGKLLAGARFSLAPTEEALEGTTDETGTYLFPGEYSPGQEYALTELKAPDGYCAVCVPIRFMVQQNGETGAYEAVLVDTDGLSEEVGFSWDDSAVPSVLCITVKNHTGYRLPETGGMGTLWFTFGGLLLMAAAVMWGYTLRRLQERRSRK